MTALRNLALLIILALVLAGCASNVYVPYPHPQEAGARGTILVKLTESMQGVNVQVDGQLAAEDEYTDRVEVQDVPVGERSVLVAASEFGRTRPIRVEEVVTVEAGEVATILIETPPHGPAYYIVLAFAILAPWMVY